MSKDVFDGINEGFLREKEVKMRDFGENEFSEIKVNFILNFIF